MKYHHLGIPTKEKREGEYYLEEYKMYVSGYDTSPFRIEWMRFEEGCPLPEIVKTIPHIAFEVNDILKSIKGRDVLIKPNSPAEGITVTFIVDNGAPVEFLEISEKNR